MNVICLLPRIQSSRYQVGLGREYSEEDETYRKRLARRPKVVQCMEKALDTVIVDKVGNYVKVRRS